jgi:hypothetical protein
LVARACHLVILAEIVTRWPALQRLHHSIDGKRGLQILAEAASDDARWQAALTTVGLSSPKEEKDEDEEKEGQPPATHDQALSNLRTLLKEYDGCAVADLAAQLL